MSTDKKISIEIATEFGDLVRRIMLMESSLNVDNHHIQKAIEEEVQKWVIEYHGQKGRRTSWQSSGAYDESIPDTITIDGVGYTPQQIYDHVKAKDGTGMQIMKKIYETPDPSHLGYRSADEFVRKELLKSAQTPDGANYADLDKIVYIEGNTGTKVTNRDIFERLINFKSCDCPFLWGLDIGIKALYISDISGLRSHSAGNE